MFLLHRNQRCIQKPVKRLNEYFCQNSQRVWADTYFRVNLYLRCLARLLICLWTSDCRQHLCIKHFYETIRRRRAEINFI